MRRRTGKRRNFHALRWALAVAALVALTVTWDYGIQKNFDTVVPGEIYRSGQPSARQLEAWIERYGLKGILTLRHGLPAFESASARRHGIHLFHVPFSARRGPSEEQWKRIRAILTDRRNLPILVHCRGGGDRTGLVVALYRVEVQGWPPGKALREMYCHYHLPLRYPALRRWLLEREIPAGAIPRPAG